MPRYYELPVNFEHLMRLNRELKTCDLKQSIAQNIYLIISSKHREHRFDDSYGCGLWGLDFELVYDVNMWLETIRRSITAAVEVHETRLSDVSVDVEVLQDDQVQAWGDAKNVKFRLTVFVNGQITQTGESFAFSTQIHLSPLSPD
jgi:predicted component of type VI protein secretion system